MAKSRRIVSLLLGVAVFAAACAGSSEPPQQPGPIDPALDGPGAALSGLTVENGTGYELTIAYQYSTGPTTEFAVGEIEARATAEMAPIPADEPIVLVARRADGPEFRLDPQSFPAGDAWHWSIPADAVFRTPADGDR